MLFGAKVCKRQSPKYLAVNDFAASKTKSHNHKHVYTFPVAGSLYLRASLTIFINEKMQSSRNSGVSIATVSPITVFSDSSVTVTMSRNVIIYK